MGHGRRVRQLRLRRLAVDYAAYVAAMQAGAARHRRRADPTRRDRGHRPRPASTGTATDNLAIQAVRWQDDRGGSGVAEMRWEVLGGDYDSGFEWEMRWSVPVEELSPDASELTVTAEDIKGARPRPSSSRWNDRPEPHPGGRIVRVLISSGIWPPEVGGPASHGPELGRFLADRGHEVTAVTTAGPAGPEPSGFPIRASRKDRPQLIRQPAAALAVLGAVREWTSSMPPACTAAATLAAAAHRLPLVLKLVNDPAYERARRLGLFTGTLEDFQAPHPDRRVALLKAARRRVIERAERIIIPSGYLANIATAGACPGSGSAWSRTPLRRSTPPPRGQSSATGSASGSRRSCSRAG